MQNPSTVRDAVFNARRIAPARKSVRIRPVALPAEHGGWGLLFEPIVLGLLLAPSQPAVLVSLAAVGAFLARHPLKLAIGDRRRGRRSPRTVLAERFAIVYLAIASLSLSLAIKTGGASLLLPLLIAAPVIIIQLMYDSMGRSRALIAELSSGVSTGAVAATIAISGGWSRSASFALWVILAARNVPTILYLRARLRILHQKHASKATVVIAHVAAIAVVAVLARAGVAPLLALAALTVLLLRAVFGLTSFAQSMTAKRLGVRELGFGAMTVFAVAVGHAIGW